MNSSEEENLKGYDVEGEEISGQLHTSEEDFSLREDMNVSHEDENLLEQNSSEEDASSSEEINIYYEMLHD